MMGKKLLLSEEMIKGNPFFRKIDMTTIINGGSEQDNVTYYRVLDGISPEITSMLYNELIINNFNDDECEDETDFQAFFVKNLEKDNRRENINIIAVKNDNCIGLLTGMAFHKSELFYFDYISVKQSTQNKGIGSNLFIAGKMLVRQIAQKHVYDNSNLAILLTVEKSNSTMNSNKGQDTQKRLIFYKKHNCMKVIGMPCFVPGIYNSKTGKQKKPMECFDWLICGVNRIFKNDEIVMNREKALQFNADNLDLQYADPKGRPAENTETYKKIEKTISSKIYAKAL